MLKRKRILTVFLFSISLLGFVFCPSLSVAEKHMQLPEWAERIEFSFQYETDKKPTFYLQTVQALYQDLDKINTIFFQPRVNIRGGRSTYNLGFGYRKLVSEDLILGFNIFGDYQDLHSHGRAGAGLEALGQIFEARINSYFAGITSKKTVEDRGTGTVTQEEVVDGWDLEIGAPMPYMPWLKVYGSGFWYDYEKFDDKYGWKTRIEARVNEHMRVEVYSWDDNKGPTELGGRLRFNLAFGNIFDVTDAFKFSDEPFPKKDLREELLIPVERDFEIQVERFEEAGGFVVEAGRS